MNKVFFWIVATAFLFAILNNTPAEVGQAALDSAKGSVDLAIGLIGYIVLFLGLMKIVEKAGGLRFMAWMIRPLLIRLFPSIPPDHPAMGAMVMNISANALGLGNAATPFGLKAMAELNKLNRHKGVATNAMALFLAINTSGLALLPTGIIGLRAQFGSSDPAAIFPTTLMATALSTVVGVLAAKYFSRLSWFKAPPADPDFIPSDSDASRTEASSVRELVPMFLFGLGLFGLVTLIYMLGEKASVWIMPCLVFGMLLIGVLRRVAVYDAFIEGAKEGFSLGVMIIPYLVAILSAIGMLRASGGMDVLVGLISPLTDAIKMPGEVLPLALLRPMSGSGAFGITSELISTHGPDSYIGNLVSTMNGSTETTFYVLAVYFGSVGIYRYRHALVSGICADIAGVLGSLLAVNLLLGTGQDQVLQCESLEIRHGSEWTLIETRPHSLQNGSAVMVQESQGRKLDSGATHTIKLCSPADAKIIALNSEGKVILSSENVKNPSLSLNHLQWGELRQWVFLMKNEDYWTAPAKSHLLLRSQDP